MNADNSSSSHSWANWLRNYKDKRVKWLQSLAWVALFSLMAGVVSQWVASEYGVDDLKSRVVASSLGWVAGVAGNLFCGAVVALAGLAFYYSKPGESTEEDQHSFEGQVKTSLNNINDNLEAIKNLDIKMLDLISDLNVFGGFEGILVAYNAPLIWEKKFPERALVTHILRYKDSRFRSAEYCYPILGCKFVSADHQHQWNERIHTFFSLLEDVRRISTVELHHLRETIIRGDLTVTEAIRDLCQKSAPEALLAKLQLTDKELSKMSFYLPRLKEGEFEMIDMNHGMTFFMGRRHGKDQVIYYQVNPLFLSGIDPKHAILIREREFCKSVDNFHRGCKGGILSREALSLTAFLDMLEKIDPLLTPRTRRRR